MKKIISFIIIFLIFSLCMAINTRVYANYSIENIFTDAQDFLQKGNDVNTTISRSALRETSSFIFKLLLSIGIVVATVVGVVLGIQFMVSSVENKAKIKEALIAYVISCIVLFGAYPIWKLVIGLASSVTEKTATTSSESDSGELIQYHGGEHDGHYVVKYKDGTFYCTECKKGFKYQ